MATFRFIHAADIHLDSPLQGLAGVGGSAAERIRAAPREAFEQLIERAIEEQVAFLVIAGDLYDGPWKDVNTGLFFAGQMGRLNQARIPAFVLHGNHDAENEFSRRLTLPDNVRTFGSAASETFRLDEIAVALHGRSFPDKAVTENLVPEYPEPVAGAFNIGVLHTALEGAEGHASYAPCSLQELTTKGYDYWALGHVHRRQVLGAHPHVVFPGNLQGRHVRETGPKGAALVTIEDGEVAGLDWLDVDVVRWAVTEIDIAAVESEEAVIAMMRDAVAVAAGEADGRLVACRLRLTGRTELHPRLVAGARSLLEEARAGALGLGEDVAWVEQVLVDTSPALSPEQMAAREDVLGDLQRMLAEAGADGGLIAALTADLGQLIATLEHELIEGIEDAALAAASEGDTERLIVEVAPFLMSRLQEAGD